MYRFYNVPSISASEKKVQLNLFAQKDISNIKKYYIDAKLVEMSLIFNWYLLCAL